MHKATKKYQQKNCQKKKKYMIAMSMAKRIAELY